MDFFVGVVATSFIENRLKIFLYSFVVTYFIILRRFTQYVIPTAYGFSYAKLLALGFPQGRQQEAVRKKQSRHLSIEKCTRLIVLLVIF